MKAHRTDAFSLTFGLIFLGAAAIWLINQVVHTELPGIGWFIAGTLIVAGAVGLLTSLRSDRARPAEETDELLVPEPDDGSIGAEPDPYRADPLLDDVPAPMTSDIEPDLTDRNR
jgi:hypothetical protein